MLISAFAHAAFQRVSLGRHEFSAVFYQRTDDTSFGMHLQGYYRELPYGWEVLAENLMDPSHLPFAHHGVLNRRCVCREQPSQQMFICGIPNILLASFCQLHLLPAWFLSTA